MDYLTILKKADKERTANPENCSPKSATMICAPHIEGSGTAKGAHESPPKTSRSGGNFKSNRSGPIKFDSTDLPQLTGRANESGDFVLTVDAIPALAERLRLQGWKVVRRGNELICTSPWSGRIQ